jgi:hypothetical protein
MPCTPFHAAGKVVEAGMKGFWYQYANIFALLKVRVVCLSALQLPPLLLLCVGDRGLHLPPTDGCLPPQLCLEAIAGEAAHATAPAIKMI